MTGFKIPRFASESTFDGKRILLSLLPFGKLRVNFGMTRFLLNFPIKIEQCFKRNDKDSVV